LLNVVNTVNDGSVFKAVKTLREQRKKVVVDEAPIQMTNEFASMLDEFDSISTC